MKKLLILLLFLLCLVGCSKEQPQESDYEIAVRELESASLFSQDYPFTVEASVEKLTDQEMVYHITIDSPKEELYQVKALVMHDKSTEDIYPSIGILDDSIDLIPGKEDVKGIVLIGYLPYQDESSFDLSFKLMVEWKNKENITKKVYIQLPFDKK